VAIEAGGDWAVEGGGGAALKLPKSSAVAGAELKLPKPSAADFGAAGFAPPLPPSSREKPPPPVDDFFPNIE
jgi:hypothetical protein